MDRRALAVVGIFAVLAAVALGWLVSPDRGASPGVAAPAVGSTDAVGAPAVIDRTRPAPPRVAQPLRGADPDPPVPAWREPAQHFQPPLDPTEVLAPDQQGIALAAMQRRDRLLTCWARHASGGSSDRFTLRMTVSDAGDGVGAVDVEVPHEPGDAALHACLADAFADARFVSPGDVAQSVVWPVPLPPVSQEP